MRKILVLAALLIAAAGFLIFTAPGHLVLSVSGVVERDCADARLLYRLGFNVPQCTCGNCSAPAAAEPPQRPQ
jgi:hypothetical protein